MNETFLLIGRIQIAIQVSLWIFSIYNCIFNILPHLEVNYTSEFLITIILTFHLICFFRNFYLTVHRESYIETESVDLYIKTKNISNNFYSNDYLEMCKKCDNLRFKRSHHCSICNRCVEMMDHHCIVLNSCIGRRNYKYFLSYLYLTVVNSFIVFSLSGISIYKYNMEYKEKNHTALEFYLYFPFKTGSNLIISLCAFVFVGYFFVYHLFLVYKGITSLERKYNLIRNNGNNSFNDLDDDNNANGKRDGYKISNSYEEGIRTNKFLGKFEIMHKNILKVLESKSILEIYWPD